jgi:hypothetical protein
VAAEGVAVPRVARYACSVVAGAAPARWPSRVSRTMRTVNARHQDVPKDYRYRGDVMCASREDKRSRRMEFSENGFRRVSPGGRTRPRKTMTQA